MSFSAEVAKKAYRIIAVLPSYISARDSYSVASGNLRKDEEKLLTVPVLITVLFQRNWPKKLRTWEQCSQTPMFLAMSELRVWEPCIYARRNGRTVWCSPSPSGVHGLYRGSFWDWAGCEDLQQHAVGYYMTGTAIRLGPDPKLLAKILKMISGQYGASNTNNPALGDGLSSFSE